MKYWVIFFVYIFSAVFYLSYSAQGCSTNDKGVVTGGACSIQDLKKQEQTKAKENVKSSKPEKQKKDKKTK